MNMINECIDCGFVGEEVLWLTKGRIGKTEIKEYSKVEQEGDSDNVILDTIDIENLAKKYNVSEEEMEELVSNGEVCCPKCKSLRYFIK